jgi:hypothetical protein
MGIRHQISLPLLVEHQSVLETGAATILDVDPQRLARMLRLPGLHAANLRGGLFGDVENGSAFSCEL